MPDRLKPGYNQDKRDTMSQTPSVTFIGHSTLVFEMDGVRILTDPLLRRQVTFLHRYVPPVDQASYQNVDAVLISHLHYDHLDFPSLRMVGEIPRLIVPAGSGPLLSKHGFTQFEEMHIDDQIKVGDITLRATPADHVRKRGPGGPSADCLGFILEGSLSIYFPGDTRLFSGMAHLAKHLDLALMPVWGWGYNRGKMHMGPREAAQALALLRPRLAIPIHWGTYAPIGTKWLKPAYLSFPPIEFVTWTRKYAPDVKTTILTPGEKFAITS
jgi:L-ascorbate metabolism protein UlaG (beta-lactamase superfamily)